MTVTVSGLTQLQQGFINVNDGKLFYQKTGTGPTIVFLHGLCLDHRMWHDQVNYFSKSFTCISIDLRGFGKSSVPTTTPYSYHEDLNTLLDSLYINEPVVLIALSMGGKAAVNFSLAYPKRTKALILADVTIDGYIFQNFKLEPIYVAGREKGIDTANQLFLNHPIFNSAKKDTVSRRLRNMILSYSGWHWVNKNPILGLTPPAIQQLEQIKLPVLIITGEKDISDFQNVANMLNKKIRQSMKKEIPGAGHMCNMEKPDTFNSIVYNFLTTGK